MSGDHADKLPSPLPPYPPPPLPPSLPPFLCQEEEDEEFDYIGLVPGEQRVVMQVPAITLEGSTLRLSKVREGGREGGREDQFFPLFPTPHTSTDLPLPPSLPPSLSSSFL